MRSQLGIIIANNIRAERNRNNLSQDELCEKIDITRRTYTKYETDASRIPARLLVDLSDALGCGIDAFFVGIEFTNRE